jgi:Domain of unknown function (DUF4145)
MKRLGGTWPPHDIVVPRSFRCGFCDCEVASHKGWEADYSQIYICPACNRPSFFLDSAGEGSQQVPQHRPGGPIDHLPSEVEELYAEARSAMAANAPTLAVLGFRKLLMHVAVGKGAPTSQTFQQYVTFLDVNHHVPVGAKDWIDHIRTRGNEANHEIKMMSKEE